MLADAVGADSIELVLDGLALTHCVKYTAEDAREQTYKGKQWAVTVIIDCTRPIVLPGENADAVIARERVALQSVGISVVSKNDFLAGALPRQTLSVKA